MYTEGGEPGTMLVMKNCLVLFHVPSSAMGNLAMFAGPRSDVIGSVWAVWLRNGPVAAGLSLEWQVGQESAGAPPLANYKKWGVVSLVPWL